MAYLCQLMLEHIKFVRMIPITSLMISLQLNLSASSFLSSSYTNSYSNPYLTRKNRKWARQTWLRLFKHSYRTPPAVPLEQERKRTGRGEEERREDDQVQTNSLADCPI